MPHRSGIWSAIVILEVVAPLALALNGGVAIFSRVAVLELSIEVGHGEACRCWHASRRWCA
jgi:hypothetical protein